MESDNSNLNCLVNRQRTWLFYWTVYFYDNLELRLKWKVIFCNMVDSDFYMRSCVLEEVQLGLSVPLGLFVLSRIGRTAGGRRRFRGFGPDWTASAGWVVVAARAGGGGRVGFVGSCWTVGLCRRSKGAFPGRTVVADRAVAADRVCGGGRAGFFVTETCGRVGGRRRHRGGSWVGAGGGGRVSSGESCPKPYGFDEPMDEVGLLPPIFLVASVSATFSWSMASNC